MTDARLGKHACGKENGFTLTELLVAMVLAGIVMASLYSAYLTQQRSYQTTEDVNVVQQNLRSAMYFVEKDLRMAGYDPKDSGGCGFTTTSSNEIRFTLDRNEDGDCDSTEYIRYRHNSDDDDNTLVRDTGTGIDGTNAPVASDITNVSFSYFSSAGSGTTVAGSVRYVVVDMQASRGGHSRNLNTRVVCRNVGL